MNELTPDVRDFLRNHPRMVLRPTKSTTLVFEGIFEFVVIDEQGAKTEDAYELRIEVPPNFPSELPKVYEIGCKIPNSPENHVNADGSLCLGSPLRLMFIAQKGLTLLGFAANCVLPFLYAHSIGRFLFGELSHGLAGLIEDYKDLFRVQTKQQVFQCLVLASLKRRIANKRRCPCGCGHRLGVCKFREIINDLRKIASRSWFSEHKHYLESQA